MSLLYADIGLGEAWRCLGCKRLIYNKDPRGVPCAGAPIPRYISKDFDRVCSLCYDMHRTIEQADSRYWNELPKNQSAALRPDPFYEYC